MVAVTGDVPALVAVKDAMLPVPLAAKPIEGVLLTQLYTVPLTAPEKVMAVVERLLQTVWLLTVATSGTGLTVTVALPVMVTVQFIGEGNTPEEGVGLASTVYKPAPV